MAPEIRAPRPGEAAAYAAVHVACWHESYRGIIADEVIDARDVTSRTALWERLIGQPDRITFGAYRGGELRGFAGAAVLGPPRQGFDGFLEMLYVRADAQGAGIGRLLVSHVARELLRRGAASMALRVLRLNPARGFYECLGAELLPGFTYQAGQFDDVAYGFAELRRLL